MEKEFNIFIDQPLAYLHEETEEENNEENLID